MTFPSAWGCILQLGCEKGETCAQNLNLCDLECLCLGKQKLGQCISQECDPVPGANSQHRQLSLHVI